MYKRQVCVSVQSSKIAILFATSVSECLHAVSYTHLDVYKRQVKVIDIDNRGRIRLSRKAALAEGEV